MTAARNVHFLPVSDEIELTIAGKQACENLI
jgi:hypothetical protein